MLAKSNIIGIWGISPPYVTVFGTPDILPYPNFTGLLSGVDKVLPRVSKLLERGFEPFTCLMSSPTITQILPDVDVDPTCPARCRRLCARQRTPAPRSGALR